MEDVGVKVHVAGWKGILPHVGGHGGEAVLDAPAGRVVVGDRADRRNDEDEGAQVGPAPHRTREWAPEPPPMSSRTLGQRQLLLAGLEKRLAAVHLRRVGEDGPLHCVPHQDLAMHFRLSELVGPRDVLPQDSLAS